jgi:signal transduction histidine kinase
MEFFNHLNNIIFDSTKPGNMKIKKPGIFISVFILFVISTLSPAQIQKADSLRRLISTVQDDSIKILLGNKLILSLTPDDSLEARKLSKQNMQIAEQKRSSYLEGDCFLTAGIFYSRQAEYELAMNNLTNALHLFSSRNDKEWSVAFAKTQIVLGSIYHQQGDFATALGLYLPAEEIASRNNEYTSLRDVTSKIGDCYLKLNQFDTAGIYARKNLKIVEKLSIPDDIAAVYIDYGNWLTETNKYEEGLMYYDKAGQLLQKADNQGLYHTWYYNYGFLLSRKGKFAESLVYYEKAYNAALNSGVLFDQIDARYKMGLMNYYLKNYEVASSILTDALNKAKEIKSSILQRNILDALSCLESDRQNYHQAYNLLNGYIDAANDVSSDEARKQMNFVNAKYKARERSFEIEKLETEKKVQNATIQRRNAMVFALSGILLISFIAGFTIYRNFKITREISRQKAMIQEQRIHELEQERQIIALNSTLQGEETERSRLARDLHDGLGGLLSGLKLTLMNMKGNAIITPEALDLYDHALGLLDTSIKELRHVAHNLMPETLFRYGLRQTLSDFCEGVGNVGLKVSFAFYGMEKRYDEKLEIASYRIVQELVNNAMKHSEASEISVQLVCEVERLSITVQDNGKGMDIIATGQSKGKGLANIRSRVTSFGGHFDLSSEHGKGTEANIEFKT